MDCGSETCVGFVVARGDAAKFFKIAEEVLDELALTIHGDGAEDESCSVALGWDDGACAALVELGAQRVAVESLVANERIPLAPAPCWWTRKMVSSMIAYKRCRRPSGLDR